MLRMKAFPETRDKAAMPTESIMKNLSLRAMMTGSAMIAVDTTIFSILLFPFNTFLLLFWRRAVNKGSLSEVFGVHMHDIRCNINFITKLFVLLKTVLDFLFKLFAYVDLKILINSTYLQSVLQNMSRHVTSEINGVLICKRFNS